MANSPTITQADREAVAEHARNKWSGEDIYTAFARHREQAVAEKDAEIARLAEALAQIAYEGPDDPAMLAHDILKTTARPICQPRSKTMSNEQLARELEAENARLRGLLEEFVDVNDEPCWRDHHGYCQAHFLEESCLVERSRKALEGRSQPKEQDDDQ